MTLEARENSGSVGTGLPIPARGGKLDPDVLAFVEALARFTARKDHEAELKRASRELN